MERVRAGRVGSLSGSEVDGIKQPHGLASHMGLSPLSSNGSLMMGREGGTARKHR